MPGRAASFQGYLSNRHGVGSLALDKVKDKSIKHRLCREQSYKISLGHICFDRIGWN